MITKNTRALKPSDESESDYELKEDHQSCWITVDNISVYVRRCDEGVSVSLYPHFLENNDSLTETSATFADAEAEINEFNSKNIGA